ncbi:PREDICTED: uncharacterized protein LOC105449454 [Wasmannia auropunctata]|uniref:uncharacterized protein LOC105449454 n=1 Tax=Wasmannia auropunctata TaxID=64793 RepID=UPI0005EEE1DB|nr:PREDICTED: uncharacterized protein LOC105449454 [Wasmannia auropunctata]
MASKIPEADDQQNDTSIRLDTGVYIEDDCSEMNDNAVEEDNTPEHEENNVPEPEEDNTPISQAEGYIRTSSRSTKGIPPKRLIETCKLASNFIPEEPLIYEQAMSSPESQQ